MNSNNKSASCTLPLIYIEYISCKTATTVKKAINYLKTQTANITKVKEVRGRGFMIGIELYERAVPYLRAIFNEKILALSAGKKIIRLLPPLVTSEDDLMDGLNKIIRVLK